MTEYKTQAGEHSATETTWLDLSGNGNNGTLQGGTWETNGLSLDGTDDGIEINRQDLNTMTLEMTYTPRTNLSADEFLFGNYEEGGYALQILNRELKFSVNIAGTYVEIQKADALSADTTYYITGSFDGTTIKLYVNGVLEASTTVTGTIKQTSNSTILAIGANPSGSALSSNYANGIVHTARLYDRALTEEEIMNNYLIDKERYNM